MIAVFVNCATILAGCLVGLFFAKKIPQKVTDAIQLACGLVSFVMGVQMSFKYQNVVYLALALILGGIVGTLLDIDGKILAVLLCYGLPSGLVIGYMYAAPDHPEFLLNGFRKLDKALSVYGEKADKLKISFSTGNPQDYDLIKKITDDVVSIEVITREVIAVKQCLPENH